MLILARMSATGPAALLMAIACVAAPAAAQVKIVKNECSGCTITYEHGLPDQNFSRRINGHGEAMCFEMPGLSSTACKAFMNNIQQHVASVKELKGKATVQECEGRPGKQTCKAGKTECEITYLGEAVLRVVDKTEKAVGRLQLEDGVDAVVHACVREGDVILYSMANYTEAPVIATWEGTPFQGLLLMPGDELAFKAQAGPAPVAIELPMTLDDPRGARIVMAAVTFVASEPCEADCDGSGSLDIDDFVCFQTLFGVGDAQADCDGSGRLDIDDFICFQSLFGIGCG